MWLAGAETPRPSSVVFPMSFTDAIYRQWIRGDIAKEKGKKKKRTYVEGWYGSLFISTRT